MSATTPPILRPLKHDPGVRAVLRSWRRLTGGREATDENRPTLVACSGGADSSALALALACSGARTVIAHVVHDMRPPEQAHADRDAARNLAGLLELEFIEREVSVKGGGNAEASARRERYKALAAMTAEKGCECVATAHHADDQLETFLMRLGRGSGLRGIRGIRDRAIIAGVPVVRPALAIDRADCERICRACGWHWAHDATNEDVSRLRARLRREVTPVLKAIFPRIAGNSVALLATVRAVDALLRERALGLATCKVEAASRRVQWARPELRAEPDAVIAAGLVGAAELVGAGRDARRIRREVIDQIVRAIKDGRGGTRDWHAGQIQWRVGPGGVIVRWRAGDSL